MLSAGGQLQDQTALRDAVADLDVDSRDRAGGGRGDVHRRLVALQRDQRVLRLDALADGGVHLDDRHVLEVPDVGDADVDGFINAARRAVVGRSLRRGRGVLADGFLRRPGRRPPPPAAGSRCPALTRSPTLTFSSATVPACGAGTSIVALSIPA